MNRFIVFFIFFLSPFVGFSQREILSRSFVSVDNESQINIISHQGIMVNLDSLFKRDSTFIERKTSIGVSNGLRYYRTDIGEINYYFNESKAYFKTKPFKNFTTTFNPSFITSKRFSTFAYEFSSSFKIKKLYFEASSERDLIGARAVDINLTSSNYALSVDYSLFKRITIVGGYQYNHISDNNRRSFISARLIYNLPNEKMYFDLRSRDMKGGSFSLFYFSPERISQRQVGFGLNNSFFKDRLSIKGYVGTGFQIIDTENMYLLAFDLKFKAKLIRRVIAEGNFGVRNFNRYIYGFGSFNLSYIF